MADGYLVILVEHNTKVPVTARGRAITGLLCINVERSRKTFESIYNELLDLSYLKIILGRYQEIIGVPCVNKPLTVEIPQAG